MRIMRLPFHRPTLVATALLLISTAGAAWAQPVNVFKLYKLPRGLSWGQPPAEVQAVISRERATITNKEGDGFSETWEVKGLFVSNLDSASFMFIDRKLEAVELRYGNTKWTERKAQGFFGDMRVMTEHTMGAPDDTHREKGGQAGVQETTESAEWRVEDDIVRLVYFGAIKGKENFQLVSVHLTRKQGENAMKAIAEAGSAANLKDPPGAGGPGETLFLVEPELPGDPAAEAAAAAMAAEPPLPNELFSEENLQAGPPPGAEKPGVDALSLAADAAAATDAEAKAPAANALPPAEPVQDLTGAAQAVSEALGEMSAMPAPMEAAVPGPEAPQEGSTAPPAKNTAPESGKTAATP